MNLPVSLRMGLFVFQENLQYSKILHYYTFQMTVSHMYVKDVNLAPLK